jgi:hypothetical protein
MWHAARKYFSVSLFSLSPHLCKDWAYTAQICIWCVCEIPCIGTSHCVEVCTCCLSSRLVNTSRSTSRKAFHICSSPPQHRNLHADKKALECKRWPLLLPGLPAYCALVSGHACMTCTSISTSPGQLQMRSQCNGN